MGGRLSLRAGCGGGNDDGGRGTPEVRATDIKMGSAPPPISIKSPAASTLDLWPSVARACEHEVFVSGLRSVKRQITAAAADSKAEAVRVGTGSGRGHSAMPHIGRDS